MKTVIVEKSCVISKLETATLAIFLIFLLKLLRQNYFLANLKEKSSYGDWSKSSS